MKKFIGSLVVVMGLTSTSVFAGFKLPSINKATDCSKQTQTVKPQIIQKIYNDIATDFNACVRVCDNNYKNKETEKTGCKKQCGFKMSNRRGSFEYVLGHQQNTGVLAQSLSLSCE